MTDDQLARIRDRRRGMGERPEVTLSQCADSSLETL